LVDAFHRRAEGHAKRARSFGRGADLGSDRAGTEVEAEAVGSVADDRHGRDLLLAPGKEEEATRLRVTGSNGTEIVRTRAAPAGCRGARELGAPSTTSFVVAGSSSSPLSRVSVSSSPVVGLPSPPRPFVSLPRFARVSAVRAADER
jgi:hypothetical protein